MIFHKLEVTHFSNSEREVVDYILKEGFNIEKMTVKAIADAVYTSPPILVRVAKKLGYSGWKEFKEDFLSELEYQYIENDVDASIPFVIGSDIISISNSIAQLQIDTIKETQQLINHDNLQKAIKILREAEEIDVYGINNNYIAAKHFGLQCFLIGKRVNICEVPGTEIYQTTMANEKHVAIVISYSGETQYIKEIINAVRKHNSKIIGITCLADNYVYHHSDVTLRMSSREMIRTKIGSFSTQTSLQYLLDLLYAGIFAMDYQKNLDYKMKHSEMANVSYSGYKFIDE